MRKDKTFAVFYIYTIIVLILNDSASTFTVNRRSSYILNGTTAPVAPYHAHLLIQVNIDAPEPQTFVGSGALVSGIHVITCAQNLLGSHHFRVGLGSNNRRGLQFFNGTQTVIHPQYNPANLHNNIGFIVLNSPIANFTDTIQTIALPSLGSNAPFPFEEGKITGFGVTNDQQFAQTLQQAFQRVTTESECSIRYPHLGADIGYHFCGRDRTHNSNVCSGDQGSPFAVSVRGVLTLVGISSFTKRGCAVESGAVLVRLSAYRQWISEALGL